VKPTLLISRTVLDEYGSRIARILAGATRPLDVLPFSPATPLPAAQVESIEATFYSRDIWEGTTLSRLSPAAQAYWPVVDSAPNLRWLQAVAAGVDQPAYRRSLERGIRITTSSGTNAEPVGLTAMTGLLMLARGFPHWLAAQARREWRPHDAQSLPADLRGQTAVIVGTGHIGSVIARSLSAFGVKTIGLRRSAAPVEHFGRVLPLSALEGLLPGCDWLVLACPLTAETRGLVNRERIALLPRTAGIVNVSRGEVVDEAALVEALAAGRLRGACLDVFLREPLPPESPLWSLPNVIVTPHNASASTGNAARLGELFLANLERYLRGEPLVNEVKPAAPASTESR
jgi:D-2-hydroxyacid dehydrogenase (NADP+)